MWRCGRMVLRRGTRLSSMSIREHAPRTRRGDSVAGPGVEAAFDVRLVLGQKHCNSWRKASPMAVWNARRSAAASARLVFMSRRSQVMRPTLRIARAMPVPMVVRVSGLRQVAGPGRWRLPCFAGSGCDCGCIGVDPRRLGGRYPYRRAPVYRLETRPGCRMAGEPPVLPFAAPTVDTQKRRRVCRST